RALLCQKGSPRTLRALSSRRRRGYPLYLGRVIPVSMARTEADMSQSGVAPPLEPLYEGWQRGLAIVAHPDDLEFGAAAAIARWTGRGQQSIYSLVTS